MSDPKKDEPHVPVELTDHPELLFRQVSPSWVRDGRITSQVFKPFPKDKNQLSVAREGKTTAQGAYALFTVKLGFQSVGTWAVAVGECAVHGLPAIWDAQPFEAHSYIDFAKGAWSKGKIELKAAALAVLARERGCQYAPDVTEPGPVAYKSVPDEPETSPIKDGAPASESTEDAKAGTVGGSSDLPAGRRDDGQTHAAVRADE